MFNYKVRPSRFQRDDLAHKNRISLTRRSHSLKESRGVASGGIRDIEFVFRQHTKDKGDKLISFVVLRVDYVYIF
jgi:hypothetical protein